MNQIGKCLGGSLESIPYFVREMRLLDLFPLYYHLETFRESRNSIQNSACTILY